MSVCVSNALEGSCNSCVFHGHISSKNKVQIPSHPSQTNTKVQPKKKREK